jgi:hypothetical protein
MKKLLGIIVLGLLLSGNAFAKLIILNCDDSQSVIEKEEIKINTSTKMISLFTVYTDDWVKNAEPGPVPKMSMTEYKLIYFDEEFAIGQRFFKYKDENRKSELNLDLKKKTFQLFFTFGDGSKSGGSIYQCK